MQRPRHSAPGRDAIWRLPALPLACQQVMAIAEDERSSGRDLAEAVATDPRMSMKVLRYANSAAVGRRRPAETVAEAVLTIGFEETRRLAMGVAILSAFSPPTDYLHLDDVLQHGMAVARRWGAAGKAEAVAGVLQHAGLLAMTVDPQKFSTYVRRVAETTDYQDLHRLERMIFDIDRCEMALAAAEMWDVPGSIMGVLAGWHLCREGDSDLYLAAQECGLESCSSLLRWLAIR